MANKVVEAMVVVEEDTITSTIRMKIVTQILLKEGATLLDLKTSHTYNALDVKSMDIISHNVERNYKMNKMSSKHRRGRAEFSISLQCSNIKCISPRCLIS